jgi:hypothetical protein
MQESDLDRAADLATRAPYPNPRPFTRDDIRNLLQAGVGRTMPVLTAETRPTGGDDHADQTEASCIPPLPPSLTFAASGLAAPAIAQGAKIRLGYVSPQSGPLAGFAESDAYNIEASSHGDRRQANFEVIVKDSQSNPNRAAEVAKELIVDDEVDMMIVASTPETTNPVATTCEAEGVPVHLHQGAVAALVHRPAGQPGRSGNVAALQLRLPLLLGA